MSTLNAHYLIAAGLIPLATWSAGTYAGAVEQLNILVSNISTARDELVQRQVKGGTNGGPLHVAGMFSSDFAFSHPDRFVWHYVKPYEQQFSADDQILYIFDKSLNQITKHKLDASLGSSPAAILFGSNDLAKDFMLKEGGTKDGVDWTELTPRTKDTQFQHIAIDFRSGELQGMESRDAFGSTTLSTFLNVQKDPQLSVNVFRFTPPRRADVIKQ